MDDWIKRKICLAEEKPLTRAVIEEYQLEQLVRTIKLAKESSRFYGELLKDIHPADIKSLRDIQKLPFTMVNDLRKSGQGMLCVGQSEISRIVTLDTSGTTGKPKRVYYTEEDQELTIDFFHHGMKNLVDESDVILILLPCERPGSVGDLLNTALIRLGAKPIPYGLLDFQYTDVPEVLEKMVMERVTSIVGSPTQILELVKISKELFLREETKPMIEKIIECMKTVLLSTEFIPDSTCEFIGEIWGCKVFEHYGMTEMGLGGAVSCWSLEGYHTREADLYFEIINPQTGEVVPDGEYGEVVFTTLTRKGMPFIRYRTGDRSRWLTETCKCGSPLKRLDKVGDRRIKSSPI